MEIQSNNAAINENCVKALQKIKYDVKRIMMRERQSELLLEKISLKHTSVCADLSVRFTEITQMNLY